jgi:hypothetical protein
VPSIQPHADSGNPFRKMWGLGYRRLLPIVPPDADLHPSSAAHKLLQRGTDARGKMPGVKGDDGRWRGVDLNAVVAEEDSLVIWDRMGASVGLALGHGLIAVDIDTRHRETADAIYRIAMERLGRAPIRFGNKPKALLLYAADDEVPYGQVRFVTPVESDPQRPALVEILSRGRQCVVHGPHPSGSRYHWPQGLPPASALPVVTAEDVRGFLDAVAASMPSATVKSGSTTDRTDIDQQSLRGDPDLLDKAINALPNTPELFPARDDYVRMGCAIKAGYGPEHEQRGLEAYMQWAGRWPAGDATPEEDWQRTKPPFEVGAGYVYDMARDHGGWNDAERWFEPITVEEVEAVEFDVLPRSDRSRIEILSLDQIMHLPDPKWLVERHIPEAGFGLLYGEPGCGKSFVALDLALHLAYGMPNWHNDALTPRTGRVVYLAGEGASGYRSRARAWLQGRLLPEGVEPRFGLVRAPLNFMRRDDVDALSAVIADIGEPPDLVVVDTVSRAIPGADENLQKDMTLFVDACDRLRDRYGCATLGIHHTSKAGSMRGSSVFSGQADFVLKMERDKAGMTATLRCEKQKDGPDGWHDFYKLQVIGDSLVPVRINPKANPTEGFRSVEAAAFHEIDKAWKEGNPWRVKRRRGERVPLATEQMTGLFGLTLQDGLALLEAWMAAGKVGVVRGVVEGQKITGFKLLDPMD